jgi:hypothetical protein
MHNAFKVNQFPWIETVEIRFFITAYNDPHDLYQIIVFQLKDLSQNSKEFIYTGPHKRFSIFTKRILKNYVYEKI